MQSIIRLITLAGIFAVPAVVFIVAETMFFPYITGKNFTFRILVEIITAGWIALALFDAKYRPRTSWILGIFVALLASMFVSDVLSPAPLKSFMSNFERMDGYVTLAHVFLYFVVTASMLTTKEMWQRFFGWNVILAALLSVYGIMQALGQIGVSQGSAWRIDGTLGNSTYMAVYMLFAAVLAGVYALRARAPELKWSAIVAAVIFVGLIFQTGTRGTVLGLLAGGGAAALFLAIRGEHVPKLRRIAIGALIFGVASVGAFIALRNTPVVQNVPALERLTHISLSDGGIRFTNWGMAWEGVKERPVFGWGHESFNYVFNTHYSPAMYGAEEWYDRAHNIVFDWLVQGGVVGASLYFGLIGAALLLLIVRGGNEKESAHENLARRALLVGLLVAYTVHNFFVFDNIVSYIYFAIILAYIHGHYAGERIGGSDTVSAKIGEHVAVPVIAALLLVSIYMVNIPGIRTAQGLITALQTQEGTARMAGFESVLAYGSFGNQEVREQLLQFIGQAVSTAKSEEVRTQLLAVAEREIAAQIAEKPGDARIYILAGGLYRTVNIPAKALEYYTEALKLTPNKTSLKLEMGMTQMMLGNMQDGITMLQSAYEGDTSKTRAAMYYALGAIYAGRLDIYDALIAEPAGFEAAVTSDFLYQALYEKKEYERVRTLYTARIERDPASYDARKSYAVVHYNMGKIADAIQILKVAMTEMVLTDAQKTEITQMIAELIKEL